MKLNCTINGLPAEIEIPDVAQIPRLALKLNDAAIALGVSRQQIWKLASTGQIQKTVYGTYPVASLEAHLEKEMKQTRRKR
jgi:hypothetical protein